MDHLNKTQVSAVVLKEAINLLRTYSDTREATLTHDRQDALNVADYLEGSLLKKHIHQFTTGTSSNKTTCLICGVSLEEATGIPGN